MDMNKDDMLEETYRLARDNNRMLHAMRRNAFLSGLVRVVFWAAIIAATVWSYMQFVNPILQSVAQTTSQLQSVGGSAGIQISHLQETLNSLKGKIPGF